MKLTSLLNKIKSETASAEEYTECKNRCDNLLGFTRLRNDLVINCLKANDLYDTFMDITYYCYK